MAEAVPAAVSPPPRPSPLGARPLVCAAIAALTLWSLWVLGLELGDLLPGRSELRPLFRFLGAAFKPALVHTGVVPDGTPPLCSWWRTASGGPWCSPRAA